MGAALLERDGELAAVRSSVARCVSGDGAILIVEGEAGIGKTELLRAAAAQARARSVHVLSASASELERDYAYGVTRQLLGRAVLDLPARARTDVLAGAARLAGPVLGLDGDRDGAHRDVGAALYGLYWLTANLAARRPLLLAVDDAHWSDPSTLRFLAFLARRLDGMALALVVSLRTGDPVHPILAEIAGHPGAVRLSPRALTPSAVTTLIGESLGGPIASEFARSCARVTGGVPFLVRELVKSLQEDDVAPTAEAAPMIDRIGPNTVIHSTMLRLSRLGASAALVARAVAVLGAGASRSRVAAIAQIDDGELTAALDALASARILGPERALEFVHPVIRTSVYEDIPPHLRSHMHAQAAALLAQAGVDPEEVAAHLLCAEPAGGRRDADVLVVAARTALQRGAPDAGAVYLARALATTAPGDDHGAILLELGRCELMMRDPACVEHLRTAIDSLTGARARATAALALGDALLYAGDLAGSRAAVRDALGDLSGQHADLAADLESMAAHAGYGDPRFNAEVRSDLPRLRRLAVQAGEHGRTLSAFIALVAAAEGQDSEQTLALVRASLDDGRLLEAETSDSIAVAVLVNALVFADELDLADDLAAQMLADAGRRGLIAGFIAGSAHRGLVALRRGELRRAEAETRAALEAAQQHGLLFTIPFTLSYLGAAMLERGAGEEAAAMLEALPLPPGFDQTLAGATFRQARGRLRIATGDRPGGVEDLAGAGAALDAIAVVNPNCHNWRSELAVAIGQEDEGRARELVEADLGRARRAGSARAIGIALRASGLVRAGRDAVRDLEESVAVLADSPARLEHARALTDLGAALRRANSRQAAREPLRQGMEMASRCGAEPLVQRARQELLACGGRPRRLMITGRDALTASELRIADLAARGESNRDIAQALFITPKTVENHLGRVYRKLSINSREELSGALAAQR